MHKTIFGDQDQRGLTLESALEIEARLLLPKRPGRNLDESEIHGYMDKKFRAVHLLAAPIALTLEYAVVARDSDAGTVDVEAKLANDGTNTADESTLAWLVTNW